jgi:hypothetical protein
MVKDLLSSFAPARLLGRRSMRFFAVALFGIISVGAVACHRGGNPESRMAWMADKVAGKLDLNATQRSKLDVVKVRVTEALTELRSLRESSHVTLRDELAKERMDGAKVTATLQNNLDAISRRLPGIVESVIDLHASLDAEQRNEVREFVDDRMEHRKRHWNSEGGAARGRPESPESATPVEAP